MKYCMKYCMKAVWRQYEGSMKAVWGQYLVPLCDPLLFSREPRVCCSSVLKSLPFFTHTLLLFHDSLSLDGQTWSCQRVTEPPWHQSHSKEVQHKSNRTKYGAGFKLSVKLFIFCFVPKSVWFMSFWQYWMIFSCLTQQPQQHTSLWTDVWWDRSALLCSSSAPPLLLLCSSSPLLLLYCFLLSTHSAVFLYSSLLYWAMGLS